MATNPPFTDAAYISQFVLLPLSSPSMGPTAAASSGGAGLQPMIRCDGRLLPSASYQLLYSLLGTSYGGNTTNFAVPNIAQPAPNLAWFVSANGYYPSPDPTATTSGR